jgi:DNA-binding NarL/FixJ family response regulator
MVAAAAPSHTVAMQPNHTAGNTVFIVEDSQAVRQRLVEFLRATAGIAVVGEADNPHDAVAGILSMRPDWVLLDLQLIGGTGIDVLREVRALVPGTTFIVLTNLATIQYRRACIEAGATHFFDKTQAMAVRDVIVGQRQLLQ